MSLHLVEGVIRGLTYDAGALVALGRNNRSAWAELQVACSEGRRPVIPAPVVTQVWRSKRQANLARALKHCRVESTDLDLAQEAGLLCEATETTDVVDAIVVASASRRSDIVVTSDPKDIARLASKVKGVALIQV